MRNERGSTMLVLLGILMGVIILIGSFIQGRSSYQSAELRERKKVSLEMAKVAMDVHLSNNEAWTETLQKNQSLDCLRDGSCTTLAPQPLIVYDLTGDPLSGTNSFGYDQHGTPCTNLQQGCQLKYQFTYRPMCTALATCINPLIEIVGELKEDTFITGSILNYSKYKIIQYRGI